MSFGAPHSATVFQPSKRCLGLLDATLHIGMAPKCCSCNSSNSKCLSCTCVKAGRSCLNCSTGRAGRCHNTHQTTRFQSQPVLNAAAAASTSKTMSRAGVSVKLPSSSKFFTKKEKHRLSALGITRLLTESGRLDYPAVNRSLFMDTVLQDLLLRVEG